MDFVNQYGADILRLWVASQDYRDDVPFSEEIFKRVTDTYRLFRNTLRILLGNLNDFDPAKNSVPEKDWTQRGSIAHVSVFKSLPVNIKYQE